MANTKLDKFFTDLPNSYRAALTERFQAIIKHYRIGEWESSELSGGKLCEIVYAIIKGHVDGKYPPKPQKPRNFVMACKQLERASKSLPRSIKIQLPRMLVALYEIRNNRNVGHIGGEVDPSYMDATVVLYMSKWIMAELIRIFHSTDTEKASKAVEDLVEREIPVVWKTNGTLRVLDTTLTMKDQTIAILYHSRDGEKESDLVNWLEYSNKSVYRRSVLKKAHRERLLEYNEKSSQVVISPKGMKYAEEKIFQKM